MFFFARRAGSDCEFAPERAAQSLGLFAGHAADSCRIGQDYFAELPSPRASARKGWRVARTPAGTAVLLAGIIDNLTELAAELGCERTAEAVFGAAVERWGDNADRRIVGEYSALAVLPDGRVRMSRSPWSGLPLFFHYSPGGILACPIPRPLFAAGLPKRLRPGLIEDMLAFERVDDARSRFEGIEQVRGGTVVTFAGEQRSTFQFYDAAAISPVRFRRDADYVEAATAMLGEAVGKCLALATKPAVTLSGGLDSSLVCDEMLRQMPAGKRLTSITFVPHQEWGGEVMPHLFGDDGPYVRRFAERREGLDPIFVDNADLGPDSFAAERMLASDSEVINLGISFVHFGLNQAARDAGCDWLFWGNLGNQTISGEAPWAPATLFRQLQWGEVWRLARTRLDDTRPMWRRFIATGLMPNLPAAWRERIRDLTPGTARPQIFANPYLKPGSAIGEKLAERHLARSAFSIDFLHSRERFAETLFDSMAIGGETALGMQQVFGLRGRDVLAYRPLIELCLGMPDNQFVRGGERRLLARRMAVGRLPEAQRTERRHGDHVPDWHVRMTRQLPQLRREIERVADHPELGALVDTDSMLRDLDNWPDTSPADLATITRLRFAIPAVFAVRRYADYISGRNAA
ncbi:asparagine synthase-related protein [Novosphingobium sp. B 225]|uniref:asparagine synthase-related protein n=1 Tax=Novosphingobium sp. B 225 TaxID=1961849 RepID=UPI000B4B2650|nr:asparagine synthase-related protein [Novosphingobium sp. B 225]